MGPLAGLRVVDVSQGRAGTRATGLLADYGAEVIWVEPPGGDPLRSELSLVYASANRGKRSLVVDMRTDAGRATVDRLLGQADVLVRTVDHVDGPPSYLDFSAVHARFPHLVHCEISGFGPGGPTGLVGHEAIVQALIGAMGEQVGYRPGPIYGGVPFASFGAALAAVIGVLSALYRRGIDGVGRKVETSLLDGAIGYLAMMWGDSDDVDSMPPVVAGASRLVARTFLCADEEYLGVHTGAVGAFGRLMKVLGLDGEVRSSTTGVDMGDPLSPSEQAIVEHRIPEIFASQPRSYWVERLLEADVCGIAALQPGEVFDEPQARNNGMVVQIHDPVIGLHEQVGRPIKFPDLELDQLRPAPAPGEANDDVSFDSAERWPIGSAPADVGRALLDDVHVLDFGAFFAGPYSSKILADLGADVVKVEPTVGDQLRGLVRPFQAAQAGKRGVAVNLKDEEARRVLEHLFQWADVVHHNMRPGAAERVGVGAAQARAINPRLVYMHTPGWGTSGPLMMRQSFEPLMSGYVGVSYESGGRFNPPTLPLCNGDPGNGLLGAAAILMGLLHRQRTGEAPYLENPQLDATMTHLSHIVRRFDGEVLGARRLDPLQLGVSPFDSLYETDDGWICVVAEGDDKAIALAKVLEFDLQASEFADREVRHARPDDLRDIFAERFRGKSTATWLTELSDAGVAAAEPIPTNNAARFLRDIKNQATGRVSQVDGGRHGDIRFVGRLVRVTDCAMPVARRAPYLGEHTAEVLGAAGYSDDQIANLEARGAIRCTAPTAPTP